jgi:tetratricopeptide (TPR) repeat protein
MSINLANMAFRIGDRESAETLLHSAMTRLESQTNLDGEAAAVRLQAMIRLGHISPTNQTILDDAVDIARRQYEKDGNAQFRTLEIEALVERARRASLSGQHDAAAIAAAEAISRATIDGDVMPDEELTALLANAHEWASTSRLKLGQCAAAEIHLVRAVELNDRILETAPWDFLALRARLTMDIRLAAMHRRRGDLDDAIAATLRAINTGERLIEIDPLEATVARDLITAYHDESAWLYEENAAASQVAFEKADAIIEEHLLRAPGDSRWQEQRALHLIHRGRQLFDAKDSAAALEQFLVAESIYRAIAAQGATDVDVEYRLAYCLGLVGKCHRRLGRMDEATVNTTASLGFYLDQLATDPNSLDLKIRVIEAQYNTAQLGRHSGDREQMSVAIELFEQIRSNSRAILESTEPSCHTNRLEAYISGCNAAIESINTEIAAPSLTKINFKQVPSHP